MPKVLFLFLNDILAHVVEITKKQANFRHAYLALELVSFSSP